ncbi:MAG: VOC family protein [Acidimicrobiia bacterium]
MRFHHVQLAIPPEGEGRARRFWVDLLRFEEIPKPEPLGARGGLWARSGDAEVHLGVEEPFTPARKAHPAFLVDGLDGFLERLEATGHPVVPDDLLPGHRRIYLDDPFGNRIELIQVRPAGPGDSG